jgi:hypothetical protein
MKGHLCSSACLMSETTQRITTKLGTGIVSEPCRCVVISDFNFVCFHNHALCVNEKNATRYTMKILLGSTSFNYTL